MDSKKEFNKTRAISEDELRDLLVVAGGKALKLNEFPDNTHIVAKIVSEPVVKHFPTDDTDENGNIITKDIPYYGVEYKYKDKRIPLLLRTSLGAYNKFKENNTGKDYISKYAIFTKAYIDGKNMHSVGVIYKEGFEPVEFVNPLDVMNSVSDVDKSVDNVKQFDANSVIEWVNNYKTSVKKFNDLLVEQGSSADIKQITLESCSYQYFRVHHEDEFKVIAELFR